MLFGLLNWFYDWQPAASSGGGGGASSPAAGGGGPGGAMGMLITWGPMLLIFVIFYFLLIRPQQKKQRETDEMLKALRKGMKVRTTSGIKGEITEVTEREVILLIADKVKINLLKSHVAGVESDTAEVGATSAAR